MSKTSNKSIQEKTDKRPIDCIGIDVAKKTFDAAYAGWSCVGQGVRPGALPTRHFTRDEEGAAQLLSWVQTLRDHEDAAPRILVVMEATGRYSVEIATWLGMHAHIECAIVNGNDAAHHRKGLGLQTDTDAIAAQALALFGLERRPRTYEAAPVEIMDLRSMTRHRTNLVEQRASLKNRIQEPENCAKVRRALKRQLRFLDTEINKIDKAMKEHVDKHPGMARDIDLLCTIPGVAFLTGATVLAELGDLRRFQKAKQLSAFVGVAPAHHDSGTSVHSRPKMSKKGNSRVRRALYLSSLTTIRYDSALSRTYRNLVDQGKAGKAAMGAVMRKLLVTMRAMLISGSAFHRGPASAARTGG